MADTKLSDLAAASALDGSELVYVVQGGASKQTTIDGVLGVITAADVPIVDEGGLIAAADVEDALAEIAADVASIVAGPITVSYAASVTLNVAGVANATPHRITLTGNLALDFTGAADGQKILVELKQDATGSRLVTLGSSVAYGTSITEFTATTTAGKTDILGFIYNSSAAKYWLVAVAKGY